MEMEISTYDNLTLKCLYLFLCQTRKEVKAKHHTECICCTSMAHLAADIDKERSAKETGAEICPAIDFERIAELLATLETRRKLGRANFGKDLWDR